MDLDTGRPNDLLTVSVPTAELAEDLADAPPGVHVILWPMDSAAPRERIDIVVPPYMGMVESLSRLDGVQVGLVQGQSIGFEGVADVLPAGVPFANAASVHEASTAEFAVGLVLAAQRRVDQVALDTRAHVWKSRFTTSLADRRVLLLGYGGVGQAVAARLAPFEVELTVVASSSRTEEGVRVHGVDELAALLPSAEIVILTLPGGPSTRHIVDQAFLERLPDGALLVNVGRGSLVDTDALLDHVRRGRVRAALDVTEPEPLPADHPLWGLPGVLIAPHMGGGSSAMRPRVARLVRRQVDLAVDGRPPVNVVIPAVREG